MINMKDLIKQQGDMIRKESGMKINEAPKDKEYRKAKKLIDKLKDIVKELEAHGEDYGIFQNAKKSHKILKKLKKDMYYIG